LHLDQDYMTTVKSSRKYNLTARMRLFVRPQITRAAPSFTGSVGTSTQA
jgi:hypothetical protein